MNLPPVDFVLQLGGNVYAGSADTGVQRRMYYWHRRPPPYRQIMAVIPMLAIWDDGGLRRPPRLEVEVHRVGKGMVRRLRLSWEEINGEVRIPACEILSIAETDPLKWRAFAHGSSPALRRLLAQSSRSASFL